MTLEAGTKLGRARQIESIAVMPFSNQSGNAGIEYLSDGMTETLINSLFQLPKPRVIVIAGCNGAGKSTLAPHLLRDTFGLYDYTNADTIAHGLSAFAPERVALQAGKVMLKRLHEFQPLANSWAVYDNSFRSDPLLVAVS